MIIRNMLGQWVFFDKDIFPMPDKGLIRAW